MLDVRVVFQYELDCSEQHEREPHAHLWLTRNISNQRVDVTLAGEPERTGKGTLRYSARVQVDAQFQLGTELDGPATLARASVAQINAEPYRRDDPRDMVGLGCLNLDFFVQVENEHRERCANQAGVTRIALAELFGPRKLGPRLGTRITFPMVPSGGHERFADRGRLVYHTDECSMSLDGRPILSYRQLRWEVPRQDASPLERFIVACEREYSPPTLPSTWSNMDSVGIHRYTSRCAVFPAPVYVDAPLGHTGERYFANALQIALRRMQLTAATVLAWRLDKDREHCRHAAYLLATMLSVYVQASDYIGDFLYVYDTQHSEWRKREVEYFYHLRLRNGQGDCEDAASEFLIEADELRRLQTSDPLLTLMKRVLSAFYVVMLLDGISGREINLQSRDAALGAHMNSALINKGQFVKWAQNYDSHAQATAQKRRTQAPAPALRSQYAPSEAERQFSALFPPVVMMEGTGPLDPNGVEAAQEDQEAEHAVTSAIEAASDLVANQIRPMFHYDSSGKRQSKFYKTAKVMMMDEIMKSGGGQSMWLLCVQAKPDARLTASVEFQAIASASDAIQAMPEPELTPEQLQTARHYALDLHPMPDLEAPDESQPLPEHVARARQQVQELTARMARFTGAASKPSKHRTVRMAKYHHFDRDGKFADGLARAFETMQQTSGHRLVGFRAQEERVTPDRGGYWFQLELD